MLFYFFFDMPLTVCFTFLLPLLTALDTVVVAGSASVGSFTSYLVARFNEEYFEWTFQIPALMISTRRSFMLLVFGRKRPCGRDKLAEGVAHILFVPEMWIPRENVGPWVESRTIVYTFLLTLISHAFMPREEKSFAATVHWMSGSSLHHFSSRTL